MTLAKRTSRLSILALSASAMVAAACTSAVDVHAIKSPSAHFDRYRTVALDLTTSPPHHYASTPESTIVEKEVGENASAILQERGYVLADLASADLVLRVESGRREKKVEVTTAKPTSDLSAVQPEYRGELDQEERDLVEGSFVIDAFDGKTHDVVWHGAAHAEVQPGEVDHARLRRAVVSVLASFPAAEGR